MTPEKDAELCRRYPNLYRDRYSSMKNTCMCWGFECADGWFDLIDELSEKLEKGIVKLKNSGEKNLPVAAQVKQKFGTLRFYMDCATEEMYDWVFEAEDKSATICEYCGKPGKTRQKGWIETLCDGCYR